MCLEPRKHKKSTSIEEFTAKSGSWAVNSYKGVKGHPNTFLEPRNNLGMYLNKLWTSQNT